MTLREEIAEALYRAYFSTRPHPPLQSDLSMAAHKLFIHDDPIDMPWLAAADECIRQMEWVRYKYLMERVSDARGDAPRWAFEVYEGVRDFVLVAAPEGWKP